MTGLSINVMTIILTVAFALFAFVFAFLISSLVSKDKIASDKRLEELKKTRETAKIIPCKARKQNEKETGKEKAGRIFEKFGSALYVELQRADMKMRPEEFLTIWLLVTVVRRRLLFCFCKTPLLRLRF